MKGNVRKRSMGDIWVHSQGIFNPINVKSGLQGMNGQPNLVSMQKLLDYILKRWIDSYYLLIIKFDVSAQPTHKAYLVDVLDWTEFIAYDAGSRADHATRAGFLRSPRLRTRATRPNGSRKS